MIVRNEAKYLSECLESVNDIVDQIVVVDTGSTDESVEIAKKYGAEIYSFTWVDDFAQARNYSIRQARCEWILWIDADERLTQTSVKEIRSLLRKTDKPVIYRVHIQNRMRSGSYQYKSIAHRLFTNHKGIEFSGRIHEQVSPSAKAVGAEECDSGIIIDHLGYGLSEAEMLRKFKRNGRLLEQLVLNEPNNAYAHYTLAQNYGLQEKNTAAIKHYRIALDLQQLDSSMTASLLNSLGDIYRLKQDWSKARDCAGQSVRMYPYQVAGHYLLYRIAAATDNQTEAIKYLEELSKNNHLLNTRPKQLATDIQIDEHRLLFSLGNKYLKDENWSKAKNCFLAVEEIQPGNIATLERLAELARIENDLANMEKYYAELYRKLPENNTYADILGLVFTKRKKFPEAISIYETMITIDPKNIEAIKRLAGLYGIIGENKKSINLLASIEKTTDSRIVEQ